MYLPDVRRSLLLALIAAAAIDSPASGQSFGTLPTPSQPVTGRRLRASDGDLVVVEGDARITILRRRRGNVRAIFNAEQHWVVVLIDANGGNGNAPDGIVDSTYSFRDVSGEWPLGERWEGSATLEEYSLSEGGSRGVGIGTASGLVELISPPGSPVYVDQAPVSILSYRGASRSNVHLSFADAEQRQINDVLSPQSQGTIVSTVNPRVTTRLVASAPPSPGVVVSGSDFGPHPVRVGGSIRQPQKLFDVRPVYPPKARAAGVTGVIILEITIGTDGAVTEARVLRGIPLLDEAALTAVKQWRYDATLLNGTPVPVITTVSVPFP
jgi:TonB family protein